jgi:hypothetical protein
MEKPAGHIYVYVAILAFAAVMMARSGRANKEQGLHTASALVVVSYALILMVYVNYPSYRRTGDIDLGLQGRYLFPVLVPLYGWVAHFVLRSWTRPVQILLVLLIGGFFVYDAFVYFSLHSPDLWFSKGPWAVRMGPAAP